MDRRHLQYYVALAEELHFGRAALRLGIATPTLSVQIQQIERRLGTPLFDRSRREVTLTSAGAIFLAEARNVLRQFEQAEAVGRRAGRGEIGRIEIGYVGSAVHAGALQEQLQRFRSASPDVELKVGEWPMADLPDLLLDGRIDVVFCRLPMEVPDALGSHILIEDQFCVALPASHALAHAGVPVQPALPAVADSCRTAAPVPVILSRCSRRSRWAMAPWRSCRRCCSGRCYCQAWCICRSPGRSSPRPSLRCTVNRKHRQRSAGSSSRCGVPPPGASTCCPCPEALADDVAGLPRNGLATLAALDLPPDHQMNNGNGPQTVR